MKNIVILGSGGREHALAWKMKQSPLCQNLYVLPGNAGTAAIANNVDVDILDFDAVAKFCEVHDINLLVCGPEEPLVKGLRNHLENLPHLKSLQIIGPGASGARLEGSKDFSKEFMLRNNIPTAAYKTFTAINFDEGLTYLAHHTLPVVLKADGLAAGKGVVICHTLPEAIAEFKEMIQEGKFGAAGTSVVVEEFLTGIEMSLFVLTNNGKYVLLPEAKDYKKIGEGDTGLNTGGMGAISPVPFYTKSLQQLIEKEIVQPTVAGLQKENIPYCGIIFIGLIVENESAKVIEYNCRLGDPETEVILTRLQNDLVQLLTATAEGALDEIQIRHSDLCAAGIVAVSGGYPGDYIKNLRLNMLDDGTTTAQLFHAGTKANAQGEVFTNGGRVLVAVGNGSTLQEAKACAANSLKNINYEGMYYRSDIGFEF